MFNRYVDPQNPDGVSINIANDIKAEKRVIEQDEIAWINQRDRMEKTAGILNRSKLPIDFYITNMAQEDRATLVFITRDPEIQRKRITVHFTNNIAGTDRMPWTPWTFAHRLQHALCLSLTPNKFSSDFSPQQIEWLEKGLAEKINAFEHNVRLFIAMAGVHLNASIVYTNETGKVFKHSLENVLTPQAKYKDQSSGRCFWFLLSNYLYTMNSARKRRIFSTPDVFAEMFAQHIIDPKGIHFNKYEDINFARDITHKNHPMGGSLARCNFEFGPNPDIIGYNKLVDDYQETITNNLKDVLKASKGLYAKF